ncbi:MAG: hypothetical protein KDD55_05670 [Bdellovibrionales bacterium]|nr:hypothetical protein [Bdellovibrionales bacterium]
MQNEKQKLRGVLFRVFTLVAMGLIAWAYVSPIWWVTLKAPQYPPDAYPEGVRIHFHFTGVKNGCTQLPEGEVFEDEILDCVEEMNTINHYIGMEPVEVGAQREIAFAPYGVAGTLFLLFLFLLYSGPLWWVLPLPGMFLSVIFVLDYAGWLWWFGHNLHDWAAFSVKEFMPTVLGEAKVAQFATYSYPHSGFYMLGAASLLLLLSLLIRMKQLRQKDISM